MSWPPPSAQPGWQSEQPSAWGPMPPRIRTPLPPVQPAPQFVRIPQPPLPFARLQRGLRGYRWWRPLLAMLLTGVYLFAFAIVLGIVMGIVLAFGGSDVDLSVFDQSQEVLMEAVSTSPVMLLLLLGSVIVFLPAAMLGCLSVGLRPWTHLLSVEYRLRWRWLAVTLGPAAVLVVGVQLLSMLVMLVSSEGFGALAHPAQWIGPSSTFDWSDFAVIALLVIVLVPVQSFAEEVVFRGLLLQSFSAWIPITWLAAIPGVILFVISHGYGFSGQVAIAIFAVTTVVLTVRTGGIEASTSLHVVNNVFAFLLQGAGFGVTAGSGLSQAQAEVLGALVTLGSEVLICGGYLLWVLPMARRRRITVLRAQPDLVQFAPVAYWQPSVITAGGYR